jgi:DNA-binding winged helix-turn-helix (wHTH) protein/Tol biopolymer transport system component
MVPLPIQSRILKFGVFVVDLEAGELHKSGVRQKLSRQPFEVLCLLLEYPHQIVSREELQHRIWTDNTFVDYDLALRKAVTRLREVLGDSAQNPRFIETIPRRGYRFIAPVVRNGDAQAAGDLPSLSGPKSALSNIAFRLGAFALLLMFGLASTKFVWWRGAPTVQEVKQLTNSGEPKQGRLVTDGSRVYFNEGQSGSWRIAEVSVAGGETVPVSTSLENPQIAGLAPDGSTLLTMVGGCCDPLYPLWSIPIPGGEPRRLPGIQAQDASYFPDGRIVFTRETDLFTARGDGSTQKLISGNDPLFNPTVSPQGNEIAFGAWHLGSNSIFTIGSDGKKLRQVVNSDADWSPCCARWTPDSKYLVFVTSDGTNSDLWALPVPRGFFQGNRTPIRLTSGPLAYTGAALSTDGKRIFVIGTKRRGELVRYDEKSHNFVPFLNGISAIDPTFSRNGDWVTYVSYPDNTLWRSRSDGSNRLQLTHPPMKVVYPFISPDGRMVVFGNTHSEIYVISVDGGEPHKLLGKSALALWSPDSNHLLVMGGADLMGGTEDKHGGEKGQTRLQIYDFRTKQLSPVPDSEQKIGGLWLKQDLLLAANEDTTELLTFDLKTRQWSNFASGNFVDWAPSLDGSFVYVTTGGTDPEVLRIRVREHEIQTITSLKSLRRVVNPVDQDTQITVAPDGSPIFTRDIGTQEIYALTIKWP